MKTIIIGLGNPILSDDSVGIKVSRELRDCLSSYDGIDVAEAYAGGIRLMDVMVGYEKAIIVDAMVTGNGLPGTINSLAISDLISTRNIVSTHDTNLATALEMGKMLGLHLPSEIEIWGIEALDVETFSEELTEDVAKAVPIVVEEILHKLGITNEELRMKEDNQELQITNKSVLFFSGIRNS